MQFRNNIICYLRMCCILHTHKYGFPDALCATVSLITFGSQVIWFVQCIRFPDALYKPGWLGGFLAPQSVYRNRHARSKKSGFDVRDTTVAQECGGDTLFKANAANEMDADVGW